MKQVRLILMAITVSAFIVTTISCSKEEGCTDITATNYNTDADEDDGSCVYPAPEATLIINANMTSTLASSGCYTTGDVWTIKFTGGPISISDATFSVNTSIAEYEGTVTIGGFTKSGSYTFDIIDNFGDKIEDGSNFFSSSEIEKRDTDTKSISISTTDAGC